MVSGKVSKNLPATANRIANIIKPMNNKTLIPFDIFFDAIPAKNFNKIYKAAKINTV